MKNKAERPRRSITVRILNVLIALMTLVAVIMAVHMINELKRAYSREGYSGIVYDLRDGNYAAMVQEYYYKHYDVDPFDSLYREEYHLAAYADAAFWRQFYELSGRQELARHYQNKMAKERALCDDLKTDLDEVDKLLNEIPVCP